MKVSLRLFASLHDAVGQRQICLDIGDEATIGDLKLRLGQEFPAVKGLLDRSVCAIDDEYVAADERLHEGAEVALIPPVSGGADEDASEAPGRDRRDMTDLFRVTEDALDGEVLARLVRSDDSGAIALFYGVVRNHNEGREVLRLEYEAHESMALRKMSEVGDETKRRFPDVTAVGVWHRIGRLEIGETSLLVAVASPHRAEAFEACHWAVDRVKEVVPIWKKEFWADGSAWLEGHAVEPPELASH